MTLSPQTKLTPDSSRNIKLDSNALNLPLLESMLKVHSIGNSYRIGKYSRIEKFTSHSKIYQEKSRKMSIR